MELNLNDWGVEGYLIKRDTKKIISAEEYLDVKKINIDDGIKNQFREILKSHLCDENLFPWKTLYPTLLLLGSRYQASLI